jgi:hypothetical protein
MYGKMAAFEALPCFDVQLQGPVGHQNMEEPQRLPLPGVMNGQFFHSSEQNFIHLFLSESAKKSENVLTHCKNSSIV